MNTKNKAILIFIILSMMGAGYGFYLFNKPVESLIKKDPDYTMSPQQLLSDYKSGESEANMKYLDRIIQLTGSISKVENSTSIYLETGNPLSSIICDLDVSASDYPFEKGDTVTIKGICTGYLMDVILNRAVIVNRIKK